jgi:hypothetical protein
VGGGWCAARRVFRRTRACRIAPEAHQDDQRVHREGVCEHVGVAGTRHCRDTVRAALPVCADLGLARPPHAPRNTAGVAITGTHSRSGRLAQMLHIAHPSEGEQTRSLGWFAVLLVAPTSVFGVSARAVRQVAPDWVATT